MHCSACGATCRIDVRSASSVLRLGSSTAARYWSISRADTTAVSHPRPNRTHGGDQVACSRGAAATDWSRVRGQAPTSRAATDHRRAAYAQVCPSLPGAAVGANKQEIAHAPVAIDALIAGIRHPDERMAESTA